MAAVFGVIWANGRIFDVVKYVILQMQVLQELHQARSDKRLEINIMQRCGELTSMDIDLPEDSPVDSHCKCLFMKYKRLCCKCWI